MEGNKTNINYTSFVAKLKAKLPERPVKKPKIKRTFYSSEAQKRLSNVWGFIEFLNPLGFFWLVEVNEFVTNYVDKGT